MIGQKKKRICCICSSTNQKCRSCQCARSRIYCTGCRKGSRCENRDLTNNERNSDSEKRGTREIFKRQAKTNLKLYEDNSSSDEDDTDEDQTSDEKILRQIPEDTEGDISLGNHVTDVVEDGNCLFRCIAYALHDDEEKHNDVRDAITKFMRENKDFCRSFY